MHPEAFEARATQSDDVFAVRGQSAVVHGDDEVL